MSMPTSNPGTPDRHRLHSRCKQTCRFQLADLWVATKLLLPVPSVWELICQTSCMLCLHWPVGPTRSPNFAGRSLCSLGHIGNMKI